MSFLIVSPHLDDAVLSCGQLMAAYPGCEVVTVFAGIPVDAETISTDYDRQSGWHNAIEAVYGRRAEDARACTVLDAHAVHLDSVDSQYDPLAVSFITLRSVLDETDRTVVFPFGIAHPDHLAVASECMEWARDRQRDAIVYEELPGRVLWPQVYPPNHWPTLRSVLNATLTEQVAGPLALKRAAVGCYRSQAWALERMSEAALYVPERYWRLTWE